MPEELHNFDFIYYLYSAEQRQERHLTMFSTSALCLTPHWNMPISVTE